MPAKKKFTFNLPDEPWIQTRNKNLTVDLIYKGARYHVFSVDNATKKVWAVEWSGDDKAQGGDPADFVHEGHSFYLLASNEDPAAAAYLTGDDWVVTPIPDYVAEIPNHPDDDDGNPVENDDYEYTYPTTGVVQHCYKHAEGFVYDADTNTFTYPDYADHSEVVSKEELFKGFNEICMNIEAALADPDKDLDPEDKVELEAHCKWLKAAPTVFADVDTWKIPYPQIPSFE